ncbi:aminotransferase class I/II-fold pyridoxal phosphate-dependent enzyme [Streptomyces sp. SL13]|uniref:Aminotransferase class I/II-fold pyridoxal phosphate-dependent enzyme n=1 Tax=Streptantibioticus silvisoli TaxID=2705255 RepID=A0AA90H8T1_9ACTN|nr:aminotransferase class I/II-fold pyridoxal phosphate-dependent enzyme [Streptantibioticus silvisoli]MDI5967626.1 aminotransferase class I/II-fold pyridoxal phosphate-dependent enzyme [Streptantibioticus silvisoli]MDI5974016.1 aminotransferase class I/II-fold pyridoxal phosphate-dependent enzyme [Streptantibioticus silvisoli]
MTALQDSPHDRYHPDRHEADTLGMSPEEMRRLGHRVVDIVVDHLENKASQAVVVNRTASDLRAELGGPPPEEPGDADAAIDRLAGVALACKQHLDHPRFFARVPGPSSFAAVLGDWLSIGYNATATSMATGMGPSTIELVVIDWLAQLLGMPPETEGVMVSGGSLANLTAFAAVRAVQGQGVAYLTDQTHSALPRDLVTIGFPPEHIRVLPTDADLRYSVEALAAAVAEDRAAGLRPLMVVATAGTTNTGTVDPLNDLADLCEREGLWFHIDGAYGAPAALTDDGRELLAGMERADSLVLDPHKWLYQPVDLGCVLVRRPGALRQAYSMDAEYLKDVKATGGAVDFRDRSPELTRRSRALKLWLTFEVYGVARVREAIATCLDLARLAEAHLRKDDRWEVVTPAQLGVVTFALRGADEATHEARSAALSRSGYAVVTPTKLKGRSVLRLCLINPLTTEADIIGTLDRLARG